jgi:hypothetical protein
MKWAPKDVIAALTLVILGGLIGAGHNHFLVDIFVGIIVVYIGIDITLVRKGLK